MLQYSMALRILIESSGGLQINASAGSALILRRRS